MQFSFDLISDLHVETWHNFDWHGQATSPFCVVAGDIAKDRTVVLDTLRHLSQCYRMVFYIDGNDEHKYYMANLGESYRDLSRDIEKIENVVYLQENVVVLDGVAILATNGWWGFDFDPEIDSEQTRLWWAQQLKYDGGDAQSVEDLSRTDAAYLIRSVQRLQRHSDVRKIVIVTHTVPRRDLINHDISLDGSYKFNCMGNSLMDLVRHQDTECKIHTWCFGHYHNSVDRVIDDIHYINNCRGRGDTEYKAPVYFPKRIEVD
jgi:hypothetical protein